MNNPEPNRCCDLVMRGGLTSGVLYPPAIERIARGFYLVGIGGTSAGAIAACGAAAAEYRRRMDGSFTGFEHLAEVSQQFTVDGRLRCLFRPDPPTRDLFQRLDRLRSGKMGFFGKMRLVRGRERFFRQVIDNGYGLCSGMATGSRGDDDPAITPWLSDLIDRVAGRRPKIDPPLSFRDLHEAPVPKSLQGVLGRTRDRSIDLRAMTTCLTFRRPFELPLRFDDQKIFAFDPTEWRRIFPAHIVDFVVDKASGIESPELARDGKLPLPVTDLPIVVAARMSLSFPVLFSMVPLWGVDYRLPSRPLSRLWFSDGGITSNFPMHRFDALYPRWPTIGLNLRYTDDSGKPQRTSLADSGRMVYMPNAHRGVQDVWDRFHEAESPSKVVAGFAGAIFGSAQEWHDNAFLRLPGYRSRSAEIWLDKDEGGANLDMSPTVVRSLVRRGHEAGELALLRFAELDPTHKMSWAGHRWLRFRSGMAALVTALQQLDVSLSNDMPDDIPLASYLDGTRAPPAYGSDLDEDKLKAMSEVLEGVRELARAARSHQVAREDNGGLDAPFSEGPSPPTDLGSRVPF